MVIDSSRIRRKILGECNRARTNYRRAEAELQRYETKDKPAYQCWYRTEFGPKIELLKASIDECNRIQEFMIRLDRFSRFMPCSASSPLPCTPINPDRTMIRPS